MSKSFTIKVRIDAIKTYVIEAENQEEALGFAEDMEYSELELVSEEVIDHSVLTVE